MKERETFASRLGFVLISAGCAIGLGNVWRFPYIVGQYGGAAFVLIYLLFLLIMGLPIMAMEFAVGRASRKSVIVSFQELEPKGTKWHWYGWFGMAGNYLLMMFYTTIAGWLLLYFFKIAAGQFDGLDQAGVAEAFGSMTARPGIQVAFMAIVVVLGMVICSRGLRNGVEKANKFMMLCLLALLVVLAIRAVTLPGAVEGLRFYLVPNFQNLMYSADGTFRLWEAVYAAMGQAFFTLSLGIGAMAIFGSYIGKDRRLFGETISVGVLDTCVAFVSGLIIFPSAFAFGVSPDAGANLIFVTLPNIFNAMPGGRLWGALFFVFLFFAALSTVTAVFENILACWMDKWGIARSKAVLANLVLIFLLSLPCLLGNNLWSEFKVLGMGIMDFEDFLVSNNLLPLGSVIYLLFCCVTPKYGWGFDNFLAEADQGQGIRFPARFRVYFTYILPLIVLVIFIMGYWDKFKSFFLALLGTA
ncbi:sodium-dependent transporter [Pseudoflavonifractor phocaeensis]|uniref:sodium-dependent transporter n=1 Tax=Pseudoflavonifractor phocaeensis TaxID=1870988 RepID=UPI00195E52B2|nr:sodium-dependent transporter [Pseudoflavonifractor phocaeensis]MBM6886740.1 sodium-dependent transporter [Pseudoflavonifractor phocaeensis]